MHDTATTDPNGSRDLRSVQPLINDSTASNRVVARYDIATNRLAFFSKALGKWTAGCPPGSGTTLKTPWVNLSCKDTTVCRVGEVVSSGWSFKPTSRMLGSWKAYLKITDRSGQVTGRRAVNDDPLVVRAHPQRSRQSGGPGSLRPGSRLASLRREPRSGTRPRSRWKRVPAGQEEIHGQVAMPRL